MKTFFLYSVIFLSSLFIGAFSAFGQINVSNASGCAPLAVSFSVADNNVSAYSWTFSDGQTATNASPNMLFESSGVIDVSVVLTYENGNTTTYNSEDAVEVGEEPLVDFSANQTTVCLGETIQFNNESTAAVSYSWNFGDGAQSNVANPTYQYQSAGKYHVSLRVISEVGCETTIVKEEFIHVLAGDDINITTSNSTQCVGGSVIAFDVDVPSLNSPVWDFGDGSQSTDLKPTHLYQNVGSYQVSLTFVNAAGCTQTTQLPNPIEVIEAGSPRIHVEQYEICTSELLSVEADEVAEGIYTWELSDGRVFNGRQIEIPFEEPGDYELNLSVKTDLCEFYLTLENAIHVKSINDIALNVPTYSGCVPFQFNATNTTENLVRAEWIVNGETVVGESLAYDFHQAGEYQIQSISYFENACEVTTILEQKILALGEESDITVDASSACAPLSVTLNLENEGVENVVWDLGNGDQVTGAHATYQYSQAGLFYPIVNYTNQYGCEVADSVAGGINVYPSSIDLGDPDTIQSCTFTEVYFSGNMGYDSWEWDFGDGTISTEKNPVHVYEASGTYTVALKTFNKYGCETVINNYNIIELPAIEPVAEYSIETGEQCGLFTIHLTTELQEGERAYWIYNEAVVGTNESVDLSILSLENQTVVLRIDAAGCNQSKGITINNPWSDCSNDDLPPAPNEEVDEATGLLKQTFSGCNTPFGVDFQSPARDAKKVRWTFDDGTIFNAANFSYNFLTTGTFTVDYYAQIDDDSSVFVEDYYTISVERGVIDFNYEVNTLCNGYEVSFEPTTSEMEYFYWKVNNQYIDLSADENSYLFPEPGLYQISLEASGSGMCNATQVKNIYIGNNEHTFEYNKNICLGDTFIAQQSLQGFQSVAWVLNETDTFRVDQFNHESLSAGTYKLEAIGYTIDGCARRFLVDDHINVLNTRALFEAENNPYGCGELTVQFNNQSTDAAQYEWDFGNGVISNELNPSVTFTEGTYTVKLTVRNGPCVDTYEMQDFVVVDRLISDFGYAFDQNCFPVTVTFDNLSENAVSYEWDFGDGASSTEMNPTHTYHEQPTSKVKLTVANDKGCRQTSSQLVEGLFTVDFSADVLALCLPAEVNFTAEANGAVSWLWDFGDGNTSTEEHPTHLYTTAGSYDVTLSVTNATACVNTVVREAYIQVEDLQSAFEVADAQNINCVPAEISFTNQSIGASRYLWDFGDGITSTMANPVHVYNQVGSFDVKLTTWNELGCIDSVTSHSIIKTSGPEASISVDSETICMPNGAVFTDESTDAVEWTWYFGDGTSSTEQHPSHTYQSAGWYNVRMVAINSNGCSQTVRLDSIRVLPTPISDFTINVSGECFPVSVEATNESSNLLNATYIWDFGNGDKLTTQNAQYTYRTTGTYEISLTVLNEGSCPVTYTYPEPIVIRDTVNHQEAVVKLVQADDYTIKIDLNDYNYDNVSHYNVYRSSGNALLLMKQLPITTSMTFIDEAVRPAEQVYEYAFQAVRRCSDTISTDALTVYNNLMLKRKSEGNPRYLVWNQHKGKPFNNYRIFLSSDNSPEWKEVAVIDKDLNSFSDNMMLCADRYYYKVAAFNNNEPVSISNKVEVEVTPNDIKSLRATVKNTTVIGENQLLTEWEVPAVAKNIIDHFAIYRSEDKGDFELVAEVNAAEQIFIDEEVNTNKHEYEYEVIVMNSCGIEAQKSNSSSSLLIQKKAKYSEYELQWNAYTGWEEGVLKYLLQKQNANGEWETIQEIPADQTDVKIVRPKD